ncbi:MAG TPA: hypothetical protein PKB09_03210 [Candidatus Saccharibacteria bacterium]|nr:hypothetical protein [Candidatus Saccharibacteria bacterium]
MDNIERFPEIPPEVDDDETRKNALEGFVQAVNDGSLREEINEATDFDPDLAI